MFPSRSWRKFRFIEQILSICKYHPEVFIGGSSPSKLIKHAIFHYRPSSCRQLAIPPTELLGSNQTMGCLHTGRLSNRSTTCTGQRCCKPTLLPRRSRDRKHWPMRSSPNGRTSPPVTVAHPNVLGGTASSTEEQILPLCFV